MTETDKSAILVLGATGMLGNTVLRSFAGSAEYRVFGTARTDRLLHYLPGNLLDRILVGVDAEDTDHLLTVFGRVRPAIVINCVGIIKQLSAANDALSSIPINSLLPHRLAALCAAASARLVHISTDCVFSGSKGGYVENDPADAQDTYGRTKYLGEVDYDNAITLRTSIIGHELGSAVGLLGWFLSSQGKVRGYKRAIFSGVPTIELSEIIRAHVLPRPQLRGVYHVAAQPISKYDLLQLIAQAYGKEIEIIPDDKMVINRSLNAERFHAATNYQPPTWASLVEKMRAFG